ncbi:uncharacterized protein PADG_11680 [Paracoccidioides brasiliensis Pb18]|uniref:SRR1-like domain-containing protein n=1 Tax=Paracoccidioides brasiliensis (strain Pb18) TaxID=502780 RepID=A0A0A0HSF7_PARBD|nr:uncharacterized protein PADG_11680 [Paracoccidioides brasiliensis Pb18]KGM92144.1 hypothetical protein PADG_11680 [Paracoccidioides brasiliensis Pb18]
MGRLSSKSYIKLHALFQFALAVYLTNCQEIISDWDLEYNVNNVIRIDATPTFTRPHSPLAYCGVILLTFALFDLVLAIKLPLINQMILIISRLFDSNGNSPTMSAAANKMIRVFTSLFTHICILLAITRCLVFSIISIRIYASAPEVWMPATSAGMQDAAALDAKVNHLKNKVVLGYAVVEMMFSASHDLPSPDQTVSVIKPTGKTKTALWNYLNLPRNSQAYVSAVASPTPHSLFPYTQDAYYSSSVHPQSQDSEGSLLSSGYVSMGGASQGNMTTNIQNMDMNSPKCYLHSSLGSGQLAPDTVYNDARLTLKRQNELRSHWIINSQCAADLHDSGVKLWRKEDLADIEQQLAHSRTKEKFTVRRIDGSAIHIRNPMFGVQKPIWRPYVKFQEFWHLVQTTPDGPPEMYSCTYLVEWNNETMENGRSLFEKSRNQWNDSATCEAFTSQIRNLLCGNGNAKKMIKIMCNSSKSTAEQEPETSVIEASLIHHAIALTVADVTRSHAETGDVRVRLLAQDPLYSTEKKDVLRQIGFEVVGDHGAGGFAELDDIAPVKQIIADLARPAVIICAKPYKDPDSPRTKQMWKEYESCEFPVRPEIDLLDGSLHQLIIHARIDDQKRPR